MFQLHFLIINRSSTSVTIANQFHQQTIGHIENGEGDNIL